MRIKVLPFAFFVLSILVVESAVTGCSNQDDPIEKQPATSEHKQIRVSYVTEKEVTEEKMRNIKLVDETGTLFDTQVPEKENKNITLTDETGTPFDKMSDSQIAQIKRYDCRLRKKILPHDYKK